MKRWIIIWLYRLASIARNLFYHIWPAHTIGVQILLAKEDEVLLVKHTYRSGWYLPGGGLKAGESAGETAVRESHEELGVTAKGLRLFGIYTLTQEARTEQLFLFVTEQFSFGGKTDKYEIAAVQWFPINQLPPDIWQPNRQMVQDYWSARQSSWQTRLVCEKKGDFVVFES